MAAALITQEMVDAAAEALISEGIEPSSSSVQKRLGVGSFTTVKKCLDVWRVKRSTPIAPLEVPLEIDAKAKELARAVWGLAAGQAAKQAQAARDQADAEVTAARQELAEAVEEIGRLEAAAIEQSANITALQKIVHDTEISLAEARIHTGRIADLEQALTDARKALALANAEIAAKSEENGRLTGEAIAMRTHVKDLMNVLKDSGKPPKV